MSISANNKMLNMSITIKELNDKHQLNPNNTGIKPIDRCMCLINQSLGISTINGIHIHNQQRLYEITLTNATLYVPAETQFLCSNGTWISVKDNTLLLASRLLKIASDGTVSATEVHNIRITDNEALTYTIQAQRGNYILESGVVIKAD